MRWPGLVSDVLMTHTSKAPFIAAADEAAPPFFGRLHADGATHAGARTACRRRHELPHVPPRATRKSSLYCWLPTG